MVELDDFISDVQRMINNCKALYHRRESERPKDFQIYDRIMSAEDSSKELKAIASICKSLSSRDQAGLASEISMLYTIQILALKVKMVDASIENLSVIPAQSEIKEKAKDAEKMEKIEADIARLKVLEAEWQPYIDALKKALGFTNRYFENNR